MAKTFEIVKKKNLRNGEERALYFLNAADEVSKARALKKLKQSQIEDGIFEFFLDESLYMHLLPGLSNKTVRELSGRMYHTAYAVCKKKGKGESVLFLSLLKDTALRFRLAIPSAVIRQGDKEFLNPDYYVKELRLCL